MDIILKLSVTTVLIILASSLLYFFEKRSRFGSMNRAAKQLIIGFVFGLMSVFANEVGSVDIGAASANVRDAAPLCAGLIFGAPAGIIAGFIGGAECFISILWGGGEYTVLACSTATILSGLISAWLRVYLFDDTCPSWVNGLAMSAFVEVIHMELIIITHIDDIRRAFDIVWACVLPMVFLNGTAVTFALLAAAVIAYVILYTYPRKNPSGKNNF